VVRAEPDGAALIADGRARRSPSSVSQLPAEPGVYRFRDVRDRALYIGRTADLRRRVPSYWGNLRDRRHLRRMIPNIARVEALVCASEHEAAWLERNLLEHRKPRWNRARGGQEVPVYLRLTERSASAALSIVHEGMADLDGRMFGPYLGGRRVRLAVAGLHRVLPLAYAGDRLTGSERDMARALGVSQFRRAELVGAVTAVLDRDPNAVAAVRDQLVSRRDDAAAALLFELAARIHAEIDAVEWVVAAQCATLPEPARADVYGWADGVLVGFQVREGRLREWTQRYCDESTAAALVIATPAPWQHFAQCNAELAARLMRAQPQLAAGSVASGAG
jgi:excinuclease ABC subunit C